MMHPVSHGTRKIILLFHEKCDTLRQLVSHKTQTISPVDINECKRNIMKADYTEGGERNANTKVRW